jgi:NTP pyrophosphatase (non-canonical NTP hydrolase)
MAAELTFREAIEQCRAIETRFARIEGRPWGVEGAMIELAKQVGELAKFVLVAERYYYAGRDQEAAQYVTDTDKIGDELADIFYVITRVANYYGIDLVEAHRKARQGEDSYLSARGV